MEQILPKFKTFSNKVKLDILLHGINLQSEEILKKINHKQEMGKL